MISSFRVVSRTLIRVSLGLLVVILGCSVIEACISRVESSTPSVLVLTPPCSSSSGVVRLSSSLPRVGMITSLSLPKGVVSLLRPLLESKGPSRPKPRVVCLVDAEVVSTVGVRCVCKDENRCLPLTADIPRSPCVVVSSREGLVGETDPGLDSETIKNGRFVLAKAVNGGLTGRDGTAGIGSGRIF